MKTPNQENFRDYRNALGRFATGITIVTTKADGVTHGMTCNAFMSISLDPPLVAVAVTHKAKMMGFLEKSGRYGVSILSADQENISSHFAGQHQDDLGDPFVEIEEMPMIKSANVHLITKVAEKLVLGDHTLFVGQVEHYSYVEACEPLLYSAGRYARIG
ncbi:MAG: flavin reductase family protein [Chloroflexota bacterium]